jgi:hypothetical protein
MDPEELLAELGPRYLADPAVSTGTGFGSSVGLRVGGRIFAMAIGGRLVLKLPRRTVDALIADGRGSPFRNGAGQTMKEWVAVTPRSLDDGQPLIDEALAFVRAAAR